MNGASGESVQWYHAALLGLKRKCSVISTQMRVSGNATHQLPSKRLTILLEVLRRITIIPVPDDSNAGDNRASY